MQYHSDFDQFLTDLPTTARPLVKQLKADSDQLQSITNYSDPGEGVLAVKLLAVLVIRGLAVDCSRESPDALNHAMTAASIVDDFGNAVAYHQRTAAQTTSL